MRQLLAHAAQLGVAVHVAHLPPPWRGFYDADNGRVVYGFDLTPIERRCVLAHELGHAYYQHRCHANADAERAADEYAALLLIEPADYARMEGIYPDDEIAEELAVTADILAAFKHTLTRLHGISYARARHGKKQFRYAR